MSWMSSPAAEQDGAGPALPEVAAFPGAGEAGALAQEVEQGTPGFDPEFPVLPVQARADRMPLARASAYGHGPSCSVS
jgi:hypothetical protein